MREFSGALLDGRTARRRELQVVVQSFGLELRFSDDQTVAQWFWREFSNRRPEFPSDPVEFLRAGGEQLIVNEPAILLEIRNVAPSAKVHTGGLAASRRLQRRAIAALIALPLAVFGVWKLLPWVSDILASWVPTSVEDSLGESVANMFAPKPDICEDRIALDTVEQIALRLHAAGGASPYRMRVRVVKDPMINALAAPGGHIVVFQGLLRLTANQDELAGVLAHEIVHVRRRHTTKAMFRQMGIWAGLAVLTGDLSGTVATAAGTAGIMQFYREHETEADLVGLELMRKAGYNQAGMGMIFRRLQGITGDTPALLEYLSTHPGIAARIQAIDRAAGTTTPLHPAELIDSEWKALREACQGR